MALGEDAVWVVTIGERALRIEPYTNTATAEVAIGHPPVALTAGKHAVWVSDSRGQVWRINPDTGTVTQTTPVGGRLVGLCETEGAVFAANSADGTVVQCNAAFAELCGRAAADVPGTPWAALWLTDASSGEESSTKMIS